MAREVPIFDDPHDVAGYLRGEGKGTTHEDIANYLQAHSRAFKRYFTPLLDGQINVSAFVEVLKGSDEEQIDACRELINKCLNRNVDRLPIGEPEQKVKVQAKNTQSLLDRIIQVGKNLRSKITGKGLALAATTSSLVGAAALLSQTLLSEAEKTPLTIALLQAHSNAVHTTVDLGQGLAPTIQDQVEKIGNNLSKRFHEANEAYQLSQQAILNQYPGSYYNPFLVKQLEKDANARQYIAWITQAALEHNLNPVRFANQMHRESRQFDPQIVSGRERSSAGALGLAQFMPSTALNDYGLTENDLRDPQTSIFAAARMMADLTQEYNGDQALAEIAYNGGRGAVHFVRREMTLQPILANMGIERHELTDERRDEILQGQELMQISSHDWMTFMQQRRIDRPTNSSSAWQNQTYAYVRDIDGSGWELPHRQWSRQQQADGLPNHMLYVGVSIANHLHQFSQLQSIAVASLIESDTSLPNAAETRAPNTSIIPPARPNLRQS